jgi:hypothetical protein
MHVCVCVCVYGGERDREREWEKERDKQQRSSMLYLMKFVGRDSPFGWREVVCPIIELNKFFWENAEFLTQQIFDFQTFIILIFTIHLPIIWLKLKAQKFQDVLKCECFFYIKTV